MKRNAAKCVPIFLFSYVKKKGSWAGEGVRKKKS